jgi:dipeptidyl aminopeptidase/acylaminoacyl peptidase
MPFAWSEQWGEPTIMMQRHAILFGLLAACCPALSVAEDYVLTLRHVAELQSVGSAEISPDGSLVAYTRSCPRNPFDQPNGAAWTELHVVDRGGHSRPFVTGQVNVSQVHWTPDGQGIAFVAKRGSDDHASLYIIPVDGGEAVRVLEHDADIRGYAIHADGRQVAFLATEPRPKTQQEFRDQGFTQEVVEEDWRPTRVWIGSLDGDSPARILPLKGSASFASWSPSGTELAVVVAPTPLVDDSYMFRRVVIVDATSGKVAERIDNPGKLGQIAWSPDGKQIAMISGADLHDPREGRLMVASVPGDGQLRDLMPDYLAHVESFRWIDDRTLLWLAAENVGSTLGQVDLAGKQQAVKRVEGPILGHLTLAKDKSTAVAIGHARSHPPEVFLLETDEEQPRRLTQTNSNLNELSYARQEPVTWTARDGLELHGILVYPLHYQPGRRYPLIMCVHGGPESHVSDGWVTSYSRPGQVAAARGFAVFYPNYRGSTARGVEFSKMGQADAAGAEFDDLVDGVDHLIEIGLVDGDRVGITGGSYGGYASAWGATYYSDRFAASVMFVGISDNISKVGTTDIPEEMYLVHHRKRLWEDWEYFLERSPIRHVQRHQTPILILHGKEDPRVDPSQSKELYRHLKTLGQAPARLVLYPGEGHGNRLAAARFDYSVRLMRWMEHYLEADGDAPPDYAIDYAKAYGASPEE